jgi:hypothetical protein
MDQLGVSIKRQTGDELQGQCPVHHLHKGRPSTRHSFYINVDSGLWHCFTCGARGNLPLLVSTLTNDPSAIMGVHKFLASAGLERYHRDEEEEDAGPVADWTLYASFDKVPRALLDSRSLDHFQSDRYGLRFNKSHQRDPGADKNRPDYKCWIVPILDGLGNLMGWQAKSKGYFANVPEGLHKSESLFGYNYARADAAVLVESPLDVVRFHSVYQGDEFSCVASYGASVSAHQIGLLRGRFNQIVMALDNDDAGRLETRRLLGETKKSPANLLTGFRKRVWHLPYHTDAKDIGDMTDDEILHAIDNISRVPHELQGTATPVSGGRR